MIWYDMNILKALQKLGETILPRIAELCNLSDPDDVEVSIDLHKIHSSEASTRQSLLVKLLYNCYFDNHFTVFNCILIFPSINAIKA